MTAVHPPALDVGIVTADHEAMVRWYTEVLGFGSEPTTGAIPMTRVAAGASTIKLLPRDAPKHRGGIDEACGYRMLTILVDDIDAVSERAQAMGRRPILASSLEELGFRRADDGSEDHVRIGFTLDPDANLVELASGMGAPGLHAVGLTVTDADAARHFWVDVVGGVDLGTAPIGNDLVKRDVRVGGTIVKFWQHETPPTRRTGPIDAATGIRYLTAAVDDLDEAVATLSGAGAAVAMEPLDLGPGLRIAFVADPDENWFELVQRG